MLRTQIARLITVLGGIVLLSGVIAAIDEGVTAGLIIIGGIALILAVSFLLGAWIANGEY